MPAKKGICREGVSAAGEATTTPFQGSLVGAASVVIRDVLDGSVAMGVPARLVEPGIGDPGQNYASRRRS
jgi:acetyltransferase-like isoleucine patch superfamily enzyme